MKVFDSLPLPTVSVGANQLITTANAQALTLLGTSILNRNYIAALRQPDLVSAIETATAKNEPGSAMHIHHSILDAQGNNIFTGPQGGETDAFFQFIGGLQTHLPSVVAVMAPYVNSYRRYVKDHAAPINLEWARDNRTTGIRIPLSGPAARRVENRIAGADVDPYLIMAVTLGCVLLGLQKQLTPTESFDGDAYNKEADLPSNLEAALSSLCASEELRKLFGNDFVDAFISCKQGELNHMAATISPWEARYLGSML